MVLILVAAVGGTIGGWLALAGATPANNNRVAAATAAQSAAQPIVLPTLVPIDDTMATSQAAAAQPQPRAMQPRAMRSVVIPQPPMAMSRSSR